MIEIIFERSNFSKKKMYFARMIENIFEHSKGFEQSKNFSNVQTVRNINFLNVVETRDSFMGKCAETSKVSTNIHI